MAASSEKKSIARRCLFGRPDQAVTSTWLREQLDEIRRHHEAMWNFNFHAEAPINTTEAMFDFAVVVPSSMPAFYRSGVYSSPSSSDSDIENRSPPEPAEIQVSVMRARREPKTTPKKRLSYQTKLTEFMRVQKRLQRSSRSKLDDISSHRRIYFPQSGLSVLGKTPV